MQAGAYERGVTLRGRAGRSPPIREHERWYVEAWQMLSTQRPTPVVGATRVQRYTIPWVAIHKWAVEHRVRGVDSLARVLWAIDRVYLGWCDDRDEQARETDAAIVGPNGLPVTQQPGRAAYQ